MNEIAEKWIRLLVSEGNYYISRHAKDRMSERQIGPSKIVECILKGKVIEVQSGYEDIHILFQEPTDKNPEIYIVVAAAYPYPVIVTVCKTLKDVWEDCNFILRRRSKKNE